MPFTRREFLQTTAAGTLAASAFSGVASAAAPKTLSPLHAPFDAMKLSLAGYSMRKYMARNWPSPRKSKAKAAMTIVDFVEFCGKLKLDGTEPTSYYFPRPLTSEFLVSLRKKIQSLGMAVSATAIGNDFCLPEGKGRDRQLKLCRMWIDYAAVLGAPSIRIFAGKVPKNGTEKEAIKQCQAGINESLEYAAKKKVTLALENHGGITSTPAQMMRIMDGIKPSKYFGVNFDGGNFRTDDPYRDLAKIAPYAVNAQLKMAVTRMGKKEPADLKKTLQILKDAGYRGWVALEYEERKEPKTEIPKIIDHLRGLMKSV